MSSGVGASSAFRRRLAIVRGLSWRDRAVIAEAVAMISALSVVLRVTSLRRVHRLLSLSAADGSRSAPAGATSASRVRQISRLVEMAARRTPFANTCLHRSLVLWWVLRRRGFDAELLFGIRKAGPRFDAHAWVKYNGRVVNDVDDVDQLYERLRWASGEQDLPHPTAW